MNGEFLRGEVYWICLDDSIGGEERTGRPAVVISTNGLNRQNDTVTVAYMSTTGFAAATRPSVINPQTNKRIRVLCEQLRTLDKSRLNKYMYTITEDEMIRVEGALACTLGLPMPKGKGKEVPAAAQKQEDKDSAAMKLEIDMWRRMYEKTMDQLVELRVAQAVAQRTNRVVVVETAAEKEHPEVIVDDIVPEEVPEPKVVKHGLVEPDPGFEEESVPEEPKQKPKKPKTEKAAWDGVKVNINTVASGRELMRRTGMSQRSASEIVRVRDVVGKYEKIEDLLALDQFGQIAMKRYGHMLTVEDEPAGDVPQTEKKNSQELM